MNYFRMPARRCQTGDFVQNDRPIGDYIEATVVQPLVFDGYIKSTVPNAPNYPRYVMLLRITHSLIHGEPEVIPFILHTERRANRLKNLQVGQDIILRTRRAKFKAIDFYDLEVRCATSTM